MDFGSGDSFLFDSSADSMNQTDLNLVSNNLIQVSFPGFKFQKNVRYVLFDFPGVIKSP
jgi:hypothetical protein